MKAGAIAQSVEQRTENPCVPGSIPGGTTQKESHESDSLFYYRLTISTIEQLSLTNIVIQPFV